MSQPVCQYLRTKSFYSAEKNEQTLREESPGRSFWCIQSVAGIGPDEKIVGPSECNIKRSCFETTEVNFA